MEEFAKDEVDLTLSTRLEFDTPIADLSDVKTMMDSINVVPGLIYKDKKLSFIMATCTVASDTLDSLWLQHRGICGGLHRDQWAPVSIIQVLSVEMRRCWLGPNNLNINT